VVHLGCNRKLTVGGGQGRRGERQPIISQNLDNLVTSGKSAKSSMHSGKRVEIPGARVAGGKSEGTKSKKKKLTAASVVVLFTLKRTEGAGVHRACSAAGMTARSVRNCRLTIGGLMMLVLSLEDKMKKNRYVVVYRTGGTENFVWEPTAPVLGYDAACVLADQIRSGGRPALVYLESQYLSIGGPSTFEYRKGKKGEWTS
jgi:hypothetical protein